MMSKQSATQLMLRGHTSSAIEFFCASWTRVLSIGCFEEMRVVVVKRNGQWVVEQFCTVSIHRYMNVTQIY